MQHDRLSGSLYYRYFDAQDIFHLEVSITIKKAAGFFRLATIGSEVNNCTSVMSEGRCYVLSRKDMFPVYCSTAGYLFYHLVSYTGTPGVTELSIHQTLKKDLFSDNAV